jgi:Helix-hairpin-helix motif
VIGVRTLIGGVHLRGDAGKRVSEQLADLRRLEQDLERARLRYERAIANYDRRTDEIEGRVPAPAITGRGRVTGRNGNGARLKLGTVTLDDLRALGLSLTQSERVLRQRSDGDVSSVADLQRVPGIPRSKLEELRRYLSD